MSAFSIIPRVVFLLLALGARADDWPQWRGPQRDGVWREEFSVEGVKIAWRAPVGAGWASPSIADGRVFVADADLVKPTARERVQCFDAKSGKLLWTHAYDVSYPEWAFSPDQANGPTATPVIVDGKVYALGGSGEVLCLAAATGELLWRKDLGKEYEVPTLQCRASPLIAGDLLIMHPGAKPGACVLALDRHTGREVWKAMNESVSNSSPIIITAGGKRQLIVWTGESVTSLDPRTGAMFWREPMTTSSNDDIATPVWSGDRLLISGLMFKLAADKPAASIVWPENRGVSKRVLSNTSTPMLAGDLVFSATNRGDFVCLDAATGAELWKSDKVTDHASGPSIHITQHGDSAFLFNNLGELIRARLTRTGYEEISRTRLIEPVMPFGGRKLTWSPPAFAGRHVFVRNEKEIVCASLAVEVRVRIALAGDSTVTDKAGWGVGFKKKLAADALCENFAAGGQSSKSFRDSGQWAKVLAAKPDYVLIQFGHNDMPGKGPNRETDPATTYAENLTRFVAEARAAGAKPILVTSLVRRIFEPDGKLRGELAPYAAAARKVAAEQRVPLVDLFALSTALVEKLGLAGVAPFEPMSKPAPDAATRRDGTHLNARGSLEFGAIVAEESARVVPALKPFLR